MFFLFFFEAILSLLSCVRWLSMCHQLMCSPTERIWEVICLLKTSKTTSNINSTTKKLFIDAELFGKTGDGATIVKCPLTNILFAGKFCCLYNIIYVICIDTIVSHHMSYFLSISGWHEFLALMDIVDSMDHMAN